VVRFTIFLVLPREEGGEEFCLPLCGGSRGERTISMLKRLKGGKKEVPPRGLPVLAKEEEKRGKDRVQTVMENFAPKGKGKGGGQMLADRLPPAGARNRSSISCGKEGGGGNLRQICESGRDAGKSRQAPSLGRPAVLIGRGGEGRHINILLHSRWRRKRREEGEETQAEYPNR